MPITEELLEVRDHTEKGYMPVVDFEAWRVAVLNYSPCFRAENITALQRIRRAGQQDKTDDDRKPKSSLPKKHIDETETAKEN